MQEAFLKDCLTVQVSICSISQSLCEAIHAQHYLLPPYKVPCQAELDIGTMTFLLTICNTDYRQADYNLKFCMQAICIAPKPVQGFPRFTWDPQNPTCYADKKLLCMLFLGKF